jgi:hypothetical protein
MRGKAVRCLLALASLVCPIATASAQTQLGTGSLTGTVRDTSDGAIPGAMVKVTSVSTGLSRETTTSPAGNFTVPVLPPGTYDLTVRLDGFTPWKAAALEVHVGAATSISAKLQPAGVTEAVTVGGRLAVDTVKTDESSLIDTRSIQDLPINGRRADQFALLSPGVARDGRFGLLSYRGMSGAFNNYMVEGADDNQAFFSEARGRTRIPGNISANAVQEFQVGKGAFLAEFGRAAGGSINSVLRSGSNAFHTDGFWYFRNQDLMSRDPLATIKPDEYRHQFGGSVAGPIKRDKLFLFANIDSQMRNYPLVIEDLTGALTSGKPVLPPNPTDAQIAQFALDTTAFNAGVAETLKQFPGGAPGNTTPRSQDQITALVKADYQVNPGNMLSTYFNYVRTEGQHAIQTPIVLGNVGRNGSDDVRIYAYNARLTTTIGSNKVNEFRFQASRDWEFQFSDTSGPQVYVNGSGNFSFGTATFLQRPALPDERRLQFVDNFSWVVGRHSVKVGGEWNRAYDIIDNPAQFNGVYTYASALNFGRDLIAPGTKSYSNFQQNFGLVGANFATVDEALFAQDQWRATNRLTINYGLRWDYQRLPSPMYPNPAVAETTSFHADRNNVGPRVGVAYDLTGTGVTVLRAGYGMYYARTPNQTIQNALTQTGLTDPTLNTIALTLQPTDPIAPVYPSILASQPANIAGSTTITRLASDFQQPRVQDVTLGVTHELLPGWVVTATYMHTVGDFMPLNFDENLPAPQFTRTYQLPDGSTFTLPYVAGITRTAAGVTQSNNLSRPNPAFGAITVVRTIGQSWYNAMLLELKRRFANSAQIHAAYTLAKAENLSGSGDGGGGGAESIGPFVGGRLGDQFNLGSNRGLAPTDQRHRLVLDGIWQPQASAVRGFLFSGIFTAESGRSVASIVSVPSIPFIAPDGTQWNGYGGLYGQGGANFLPTIPRNSVTGDWNYRLDARVARTIPLGSRLTTEVIFEAFNLFNRSNYNGYNTTIYTAAATTATTPLSTPVQLTPSASYLTPNNDGSQPDGTNARRFQIAVRFRY